MSELDKIYEEFRGILAPFLKNGEDVSGMIGLSEVASFVRGLFTDASGDFLRMLALFVGISVLLALADLFSSDYGSAHVVRAGAVACISPPLFNCFSDVLSEVSAGLDSGCELFGGMIPLLCSVFAAGGGGATAAASASSMSLSLSFVSGILSANLYPAAMLMFVFAILVSFDTGQGTKRILKGVRSFFTFVLGAATTVMAATVSLQGVISSAKDNAAIRGARYAINGMVPAVSTTVGATLGTLISGASVLISTMGTSGTVALAVTLGTPLLRIIVCRFAVRCAASFSAIIGAQTAEGLFDSLLSALDFLISVLAASVVIFILEVVVFMKAAIPKI